jgi:hypothetical protein
MNKKTKKECLELAADAKKPKPVFESRDYVIEIMPLNFKITIKRKPLEKFKMGKEFYSSLTFGVDYAKEVANDMLKLYFAVR